MTALFKEVEFCQTRKFTEQICGDAFMSRKEENDRIITVLSDGLGSGVKANILASMTATMALKFIASDFDFMHCAEIMVNALPVCQVRKIGYATYTIVDCRKDGTARVIEQGNPAFLFIRNGELCELPCTTREKRPDDYRKLSFYEFKTQPEDRIVFFSDGITESGLGTPIYPLGWRRSGCADFVVDQVKKQPSISARRLAADVIREARHKERGWQAGDDMTCAVIYFRNPRHTLILTGPPFDEERDVEYAELIEQYPGKKVICGGTSVNIVSRLLHRDITTDLRKVQRGMPPVSEMDGVDLVTEGILTLTSTLRRLNNEERAGNGDAADQLVEMLRESDIIDFVVGTRINEAHQDPRLPVDLDIRRNLVRQLAKTLEEKYLKQVTLKFI
ncbi:MAG: serine/threonine protein phosphatase [Spartobacteria bacterium]|nr:serine/threonine protein phosphatase [Spartobacteria bacterium]